MVLSLPETSRQVVGNGSRPASWVHKSFLKSMRPSSSIDRFKSSRSSVRFSQLLNPTSSFKVLLLPDSAMVITSISVLYGVATCIQTSLSTLFIRVYRLNQIEAGLVYLPYGVGCAMAALLTGKQLDRDYKTIARLHQLHVEKGQRAPVADLPIDEARLRNIWWPLIIAIGGTAGYGWSLRYKVVSSFLFL